MYDPKKLEPEILKFWDKKRIYKRIKNNLKNKKKFYFLDGPPYTTGKIHVGIAWNKALKDSFLRFKRMQGYDVYDRPGFDMHGLPIEVNVEKKLKIKNKQELLKTIGLNKFVKECEKFAIDNMHPMIKDFIRMGVWMDWGNPYMTIKNEYIEGAWWALKEAEKNGFLYEGKKVMAWCPRCATALAKHELNYKNVKDNSIFVKFPIKDKKNEFLIIWTTTPWTLAFNLAVMVNPEIDYVKAKVDNETWIIAKVLADKVISNIAKKQFNILEEFKGKELESLHYIHPFLEEIHYHKDLKKKYAHSVVLSKEYVNIESGTGLVHCAPGCGPEDFEVGKKYDLPAYNTIDENGIFGSTMGKFSGLQAKKDDDKFIKALEEKNLLIAQDKIEHEYAHCWRCESAVIFRATVQWFLAVEKIKENLRKANKNIYWIPDWAGTNWFDSWLSELQDWCISRQRFWGIPLPIWICSRCKKIEVIGSIDELKKRANKIPKNLHKPWIDEVNLKCKCNALMHRIPDVLDVWLDSGAAPWSVLNWPRDKELFNKFWPADFILEGKDQIRGWFNSLICLSMLSFKEPSYKAVYMHGMILDAQGRKMSKSLGNVISPYEVIEKYGADTMRYYMISGANPGLDLNYNFKDMEVKHKNLNILWNLHNHLISYAKDAKISTKFDLRSLKTEDKYMLSKLNSTIKRVTETLEKYKLNEAPILVENLFLELSRFYIQLVREKLSIGEEKEKKIINSIIYLTILETLKLLHPIAPFITEKIYLNLKKEFNLKEESISFYNWPGYDKNLIDEKLENQIELAKEIIQVALAEREKAQLGVRWPLTELTIITKDDKIREAVQRTNDIIKTFINVKDITTGEEGEGTAFRGGTLILETELTPELELEGYVREVVRRIQDLRKKAGLNKNDKIELAIASEYKISALEGDIRKKVNAKKIEFWIKKKYKYHSKEKIKEQEFEIAFNVL